MSVIKKVIQVGIVVKDIDTYVEKYKEIYGITEWEIGTTKDVVIREQKHFGELCDCMTKFAIGKIGDFEIEFLQPLDDKSCYAKHLDEKGEGLHHLGILEDKEAYEALMKEKNIEEITSGDWEGFGKYKYYDTREELGFITEVFDFS